jgi:hypothetical protein
MPVRKYVQPGERLPLKLTAAERTVIHEGLACLDQEIEQVVRDAPTGQPVMMTLEDLDDLATTSRPNSTPGSHQYRSQ